MTVRRLVTLCALLCHSGVDSFQYISRNPHFGLRPPTVATRYPQHFDLASADTAARSPLFRTELQLKQQHGDGGGRESRSKLNLFSYLSKSVLPSLRQSLSKLRTRTRKVRIGLTTFALAMAILFSFGQGAAWAGPSSGRAGGRSFGGGSSRPSISRPSGSYGSPSRSRGAPTRSYGTPSRSYGAPSRSYGSPIMAPSGPTVIISTPGPYRSHYPSYPSYRYGSTMVTAQRPNMIVPVLFGSVIAYSFYKNYKENGRGFRDDEDDFESLLGPGVSLITLTMALDVPNRSDPNSVLNKLSSLGKNANTSTRRGLQDLVHEASLELLRAQSSVISVDASYDHYRRMDQAELNFNRASFEARSKFERELSSNYDGKRESSEEVIPTGVPRSTITSAIVSMVICIEGNSSKSLLNTNRPIKTRDDLRRVLTQIAADSQIDSCLLSADLLWAPEGRYEQLYKEDIYSSHPNLYQLLD